MKNNENFESNDILESFQFSNHENLEIELIVNLSNTNFGEQSNIKKISKISHTIITQRSGNMDFEPSTIIESEFRIMFLSITEMSSNKSMVAENDENKLNIIDRNCRQKDSC
ncbi:15924_t:CDS:2 [Cetraspora pellucida]|uniref:15924_t:CDS:1 n=1 Tax=Cetraspora pellucida TaxID=1433469 RepID=A0A9N9IC72_9GLOM|nr:15924_t:CDS:2 [Cetraspora pellucida]